MEATATTTAIIGLADNFVSANAPQMLLLLIGVLGSLFIWVLGKKGIKKVWGAIKKF